MSIRIKLKDWDIVVLPFEGKVLGKLRKDGTRKEIFTSINNSGYHRHGDNRCVPEITRSRLVWFAVNGPIPQGMQINHINHNTLDDKITNLELVTCQQNSWYRRKSKGNTSGFKGVSYNKREKKYESRIRTAGKRIFLGYYYTPEEAARAYDEAAREYYGKFAVLNFPNIDTHSKVGVS